MAGEPSEEDISMVVEVTQADRDTAKRYLKVKGNDAGKAISALLDGEDIWSQESAMQWDDSAWNADREGHVIHGAAPNAYNDSNLRPLGTSAAPTRGSSPVPSLRRPQTKAEEDEEMERALANSRHDLSSGAVETGVVDSSGRTQFGPATRTQYDPSQWAMTVSAPPTSQYDAQEIIPDIDAAERGNHGQEPRFIKHSPSGDYLPSLITIAHSIPAAREALIMRSHVLRTYGQDSDWWRGNAIQLPRIVSTTDGTPVASSSKEDDIIVEMQRLMAFLDGSSRSYASCETLARIAKKRSRTDGVAGESAMDASLSGWELAVLTLLKAPSLATTLFHTHVGTNDPQGLSTSDMWTLPLRISEDDRVAGRNVTLFDILDNTLWDTDAHSETLAENYIERCADVLVLRISQDNTARSRLELEVPAIFHVDRYLKENIEATREVRQEMARYKRRTAQIERLQRQLTSVQHPVKDEKMNGLSVLKASQDFFSGVSRKAVVDDHEARGLDLEPGSLQLSAGQEATDTAIAQQLQQVTESVNMKMAALEQEKVKVRELLSSLSREPTSGLAGNKHRYTLRGVSTKPNVLYLLRPKSSTEEQADAVSGPPQQVPDPMVQDDDETPPGWMWWRIEYDLSKPQKIDKSEFPADEVLRAVELEHDSALLVYASDKAMESPADVSLPPELQQFVDTDNALFAEELQSAQTRRNLWADPAPLPSWDEHIGSLARSRRSSNGSTAVNFDNDDTQMAEHNEHSRFDEPPAYSFSDGAHYGYPDEKMIPSPDAHEIHLEDVEEVTEMTETGQGMFSTAPAKSETAPGISEHVSEVSGWVRE